MKYRLLNAFLLFLLAGILVAVPAFSQENDSDVVFEEEEENARTETYAMPEHRESLTPEEFVRIQKANSAVLLDVRGKAELKYGVIKNSINIPIYVLETEYEKLPRDKPIVIFCDNGMRALFAYDLLYAKDFRNMRFLNYGVAFNTSGEYQIIRYDN